MPEQADLAVLGQLDQPDSGLVTRGLHTHHDHRRHRPKHRVGIGPAGLVVATAKPDAAETGALVQRDGGHVVGPHLEHHLVGPARLEQVVEQCSPDSPALVLRRHPDGLHAGHPVVAAGQSGVAGQAAVPVPGDHVVMPRARVPPRTWPGSRASPGGTTRAPARTPARCPTIAWLRCCASSHSWLRSPRFRLGRVGSAQVERRQRTRDRSGEQRRERGADQPLADRPGALLPGHGEVRGEQRRPGPDHRSRRQVGGRLRPPPPAKAPPARTPGGRRAGIQRRRPPGGGHR